MGKIILFDSVKGGVCKSTLLTQFVCAMAKTKKIAAMDCDPQGSIENWAVRRFNNFQSLDFDMLEADLSFLTENKREYDYIFVDSAGADTEIGRELLSMADIVISPLQPTTAALDTIPIHSKIVNEAIEFNPNLELFYLLNECSTHSKDQEANDTYSSLCQFIESTYEKRFHVIPNFVFDRKVLKTSYSAGLSCFDGRKNKSKDEIESVISFIFDEIEFSEVN